MARVGERPWMPRGCGSLAEPCLKRLWPLRRALACVCLRRQLTRRVTARPGLPVICLAPARMYGERLQAVQLLPADPFLIGGAARTAAPHSGRFQYVSASALGVESSPGTVTSQFSTDCNEMNTGRCAMKCPRCGETLNEFPKSEEAPELIPGYICPAPSCGYVGDGAIPPPEDEPEDDMPNPWD